MPDDEDTAEIMTQAFGGFIDHAETYKQSQEWLKKGAPSGISHVFGKAADLLPTEHLDEYIRGSRGFEIGETIFGENVNPEEMRQAVEMMILAAREDGDIDLNGESSACELGEQEILGFFIDGGQKFYLYADGTIGEAPERPVKSSVPSMEGEAEIESLSVGEQAAEQFRELAANLLGAEEEILPEEPGGEAEHYPTEERAAASFVENSEQPENTRTLTTAPENVADLRVSSEDDNWLWDVTFNEGEVSEVLFADSSTIQKSEDGNYVLAQPLQPGQRVPKIELVRRVICDESTGNIFYESLTGKHAVALLSTGWRVDQYKRHDDSEDYFVTEPAARGQNAVRRQVKNLKIDPSTDEIYYDTLDGGASVTLRRRQLPP